jgi:hypothetical protein
MMRAPNYKDFAEWTIREGSWSGCNLDGGDIQDKALECGIIEEVPYDPAIHGPNNADVEPGEAWFVFVRPDVGEVTP